MAVNESAFRFGEFRLIPARCELWRSQQRVLVQPKVLDTLIYLIEQRHRVVGRDELISAVWGRVDLADNVLCQIIGRARQLVGDSGEEQHSIRTVPRSGYRWVREVEVLAAEPDAVSVEAGPVLETSEPASAPVAERPAPRVRWRMVAAAFSMLCVAWLVSRASSDIPGRNDEASLAANAPLDAKLAKLRAALKHDQLNKARAVFETFSDLERGQADVRFEAGELAIKEGRFDDALNADTALLADVGHGDPLLAGKAAAGAGWAEFAQGLDHYPAAQKHYEHAIELLQPLEGADAQAALGKAWSRLGGLHTNRLEFDAAERAYAQARTALERFGDSSALGRLENNVGLMLTYQYRPADALPRLQRAADLCAQADDVGGEVAARTNLVNAQLGMLQPAAALASEPRLRVLRDRLGGPVDASHLDLVRARILIANGRLTDADVVLHALAGRPTPTDPQLTSIRELVEGTLAFNRANWKEVVASVRGALSSKWYSSDNGVAIIARWQLIQAQRALGDLQGLVEAAEASDGQARENPNAPDIALYAALARGEAASAQGDMEKARIEFDRALAQADRNRVPYGSLQVYTAYTRFLLQHGKKVEARAMADRLDDWANQDYSASLVQLNVYHALGADAWEGALARARRLAGERVIPAVLTAPPPRAGAQDARMAWVK